LRVDALICCAIVLFVVFIPIELFVVYTLLHHHHHQQQHQATFLLSLLASWT